MLSQHRRRPACTTFRAVDQNRVADTLQLARGWMRVVDNDAARLSVRVVEQLRDRIDLRTGHTDTRQHLVPVRHGILRQHGPDMIEGFLAVRHAIRIGPEFRVVDDPAQSADRTELAPEIVVSHPDHDRTVSRLECLVGTERLMPRAAFRRLHAALPEGLEIVAEQTECGFEQRDLYLATLPG